LASQALEAFKDSAVLLINARASTSGAIDRAFLIADFAGGNAGLDFGRVLLACATGASAGLLFVATKEPP